MTAEALPVEDDTPVAPAAKVKGHKTRSTKKDDTLAEKVRIKRDKAKEAIKRGAPKGMTDHGFRVGSDSAVIVDILVAGGLDRQDINDKVAAIIGTHTRTGNVKNIPSLISGLLARLEKRGYYIESTWRVVPPKK